MQAEGLTNFITVYFLSTILQTNLPVFRVKESSVRRRYSDFEWLRNELERDSKVLNMISTLRFLLDWIFQIVVPPLPSKALKRQLPFRGDDGIYEEDFIEDRRSGLEGFINKYVFFLHKIYFQHSDLELLAILWLRMNVAFICSCRKPTLTEIMSQEKSGTPRPARSGVDTWNFIFWPKFSNLKNIIAMPWISAINAFYVSCTEFYLRHLGIWKI